MNIADRRSRGADGFNYTRRGGRSHDPAHIIGREPGYFSRSGKRYIEVDSARCGEASCLSTKRSMPVPRELCGHQTKLLMISMPDDIWRKWSHTASRTNIVASLYRIAVESFHVV